MKKTLLGTFFFIHLFSSVGQIGLALNSAEAYDGYTLFHPNNYTSTFLIDNLGNLLHEWEGSRAPGRSVYLLENGSLLRTGDVDNPDFVAGGRGGRIELLTWDGEVTWEYEISNSEEALHHDIAYLENGNILAIVWDKVTDTEAIANGRDPSLISGGEVWLEKIVELKPVGENQAEVVWQWRLLDHLAQDFDDSKPNYATIGSSPGLVNFNYMKDPAADWIHMNAIDYNVELDQIMVSSPFLNEVWVIDHSTTTEEAESNTGGNSGKGGELLFRWGNPQAYDQGTETDRKFYGQHNAQWLLQDDVWKMLVFNNGNGRAEPYSSVEIINLNLDPQTGYVLTDGKFGPNDAEWIYTSPTKTDFYSRIISGAQMLPNGNILVCEGATGRFFEINEVQEIVWEYVNPVSNDFLCVDEDLIGGFVFRTTKIAKDYSGLPSNIEASNILLEAIGCEDEEVPPPLSINSANPTELKIGVKHGQIELSASNQIESAELVTLSGKVHSASKYSSSNLYLFDELHEGVYILRVQTRNQGLAIRKIFVN